MSTNSSEKKSSSETNSTLLSFRETTNNHTQYETTTEISSTDSKNELSNFDYGTDYHVDLLANEIKLKKKEDIPNQRIKKINSFMEIYNIKKFNLDKFIVKNDKFKICIDNTNDKDNYKLVLRMVKILQNFESLPNNIFVFTKYQNLYEEIKKICFDKQVNCFGMFGDNKIINKNYVYPDSLFIIDNILFSNSVLNHDTNFIVLTSKIYNMKYLSKYDIILDFLETDKLHKKYFINEELYKKLSLKLKNNCYLVYHKNFISENPKIEWFSENPNIEIEVSKSNISYNKNNLLESSSINSETTETTETSETSEYSDTFNLTNNQKLEESTDQTLDESSFTATSKISTIEKTQKNKRLVEMSVGKDIQIKIYY
jgi:hypothetical protein